MGARVLRRTPIAALPPRLDHVLSDVVVAEVHEDDHGGWSYWTVVIDVSERFEAPVFDSWETSECRWVGADELAALELFGAFRATLHRLGILAPSSDLRGRG